MDIPVYRSSRYKPELVKGRYVRRTLDIGDTKGYRVYECASAKPTQQIGHGPTLREYDTTGENIPLEVRERCDASLKVEEWK